MLGGTQSTRSQAEQEGGGLAARGGSRRARRGLVGQVVYGAAPRVAGAAGERLRQTPPQDSDLIEKTCGPPNGLAFSCCERAGTGLQKTNDLAREAVSCNAGLGRLTSFLLDVEY